MARHVDNGGASPAVEGALVELAALKVVLGADHKIGLYGQAFAPSQESAYADFDAVKAVYGGHAALALAITPDAGVDSDGLPQLVVDTLIFESDDGIPADTLSGWYIYSDTTVPKVVKRWGAFPTPIQVNRALQQVELSITLRGGGNDTFEVVW